MRLTLILPPVAPEHYPALECRPYLTRGGTHFQHWQSVVKKWPFTTRCRRRGAAAPGLRREAVARGKGQIVAMGNALGGPGFALAEVIAKRLGGGEQTGTSTPQPVSEQSPATLIARTRAYHAL